MSLVVGIDPSLTSAGIAMLRDGRPILLRSVSSEIGIKSDDQRVRRITCQTWNVVNLVRSKGMPDVVVIEKPLTFGTDGTADSYDRYALHVEICRQFQAWKVPIVYVHNLTRCKWATGKGGKSSKELTSKQHKREVMQAVRATWQPWAGHITNDDIADALTLAEIGARGCGDELHFRPRRRHIEAMHTSIAWPSNFCAKPETLQVGAAR